MTNFDKTEIDQAVKKVVNEYGDTLKMLGGKTDNFDKTLEEGIENFLDELFKHGSEYLKRKPFDYYPHFWCEKTACEDIDKSLTTFAHKIREAVEKDNK